MGTIFWYSLCHLTQSLGCHDNMLLQKVFEVLWRYFLSVLIPTKYLVYMLSFWIYYNMVSVHQTGGKYAIKWNPENVISDRAAAELQHILFKYKLPPPQTLPLWRKTCWSVVDVVLCHKNMELVRLLGCVFFHNCMHWKAKALLWYTCASLPGEFCWTWCGSLKKMKHAWVALPAFVASVILEDACKCNILRNLYMKKLHSAVCI